MGRKKMVMRVRSAEVDAEEEVGVFDRRHEKKPPMVWGPTSGRREWLATPH
jgi:hypothetical protein